MFNMCIQLYLQKKFVEVRNLNSLSRNFILKSMMYTLTSSEGGRIAGNHYTKRMIPRTFHYVQILLRIETDHYCLLLCMK